jgi:hypothetical protein
MTNKRRVVATSTHFDIQDKVVVQDSEFEVENHQKAQMLIDPEDYESGNTHSGGDVKFGGPRKAPTTAAARQFAEFDGDEADSDTLTDSGDDLPMVEVPAAEEDSEEFDGGDADDSLEAEMTTEFDDLYQEEASDVCAEDEFDTDSDVGTGSDAIVAEDFELDQSPAEAIALVDADEVSDSFDEDTDDLQFATVANVVHVIRSNRIIASMGAATAKKIGASDVYLTPQFQDVVVANLGAKGLRKGLVQSGFVLAKVKISASKATAKAVQAKVEAGMTKKVELMAKQQKAMEQSLAIAAVGINRRFFKDVNNELKANLEAELVQAGVRGGQNIVRAMFAQYGVSYAKSILTLANKISAMPEEMRNQYAEALDMTEDEDFSAEIEDDDEDEFDEEDEEDFDPIPTSVSAALRNPVRRDVGVLLAGTKTTAALSILNGSQSLI